VPPVSSLLQFAVASLVLAITPGPSVVLLVAIGTERGRVAAIATTLGLALGTLAWVVVASLGLGTVLASRPGVLDTVTLAGAVYLVWLAARAVRRDVHRELGARAAVAVAEDRRGGALRDGVVVNLLNPSIAVFLAALVPPFLVPVRAPAWQQVLALGAVLVLVSTVVNAGYAVLGAHIGAWVRRVAGDRRTALVVGGTYGLLALLAIASVLV
jgi:threonine/homoserine/homoserine lactone efflux protein